MLTPEPLLALSAFFGLRQGKSQEKDDTDCKGGAELHLCQVWWKADEQPDSCYHFYIEKWPWKSDTNVLLLSQFYYKALQFVKLGVITRTSCYKALRWHLVMPIVCLQSALLSTTLQSKMNAKLSKQRFWHCYENGLIKTIQMIPHNI